MTLAEIRKKAKERLKGWCRVCAICDGRACAGEVPGMGGVGTGSGFKANVEALARVRLAMRTLHSAKTPDTQVTILGQCLSMPILVAPMTGSTYNLGGAMTEDEMAQALVAGAYGSLSMACIGDGADPTMFSSGLGAIKRTGARAIAFIKPRSQEEVLARIRQAEAAGAVAVGMDVDGAGLVTMAMKGQPVGPKTTAELAELVRVTKLPFLVKGIMTPDEAVKAVQAGVAGIVVSNHGGRVLDHTPGVAEVLREIASEVRHRTLVLADGGVRTGADVLKFLALGAHAVLVGRPMLVGAAGGGEEGVATMLGAMRAELEQAMILTGTARASDVDRSIMHVTWGVTRRG